MFTQTNQPEPHRTASSRSRYEACIETSKQVRWDIDKDLLRGRQLDFATTFLPDGLTKIGELPFLDADDRRLLSQIQGRTYANIFGLAERFIGPLRAGQTVLDHACGSGVDLLLAARRVRAAGRAIGVDMTPAMREQVRLAATEAGLEGIVEVRPGLFEDLPVTSASVDVVISNGVVNLAPDKQRVFEEIARVLRPGGRLYLADVVVERELKREVREDPQLWAGCIGGALQEEELEALADEVGLIGGRVTERFNCFAGTSAASKLATDLYVHSVNFIAEKVS